MLIRLEKHRIGVTHAVWKVTEIRSRPLIVHGMWSTGRVAGLSANSNNFRCFVSILNCLCLQNSREKRAS